MTRMTTDVRPRLEMVFKSPEPQESDHECFAYRLRLSMPFA